jgi:hypothetical protein
MYLALAIVLLWLGGALVWVAVHGISSEGTPSVGDIFSTLSTDIRNSNAGSALGGSGG